MRLNHSLAGYRLPESKLFLISGVASMEQMEQLLPPGPLRTTCVIRANPVRYSEGEGLEGGGK